MRSFLDNTLFIQRRQQVLEAMAEDTVMMIASGAEQIRNRDVEYPFRADSDFQYLTGFEEPDAVLVLLKKSDAPDVRCLIFLRPKDAEKEIWQGRRLGVDVAVEWLSVDRAFSIEDLEEEMNDWVEGADGLYISFAQLTDWSEMLNDWITAQKAKARQGVEAPTKLLDADAILHEMRLIKSETEIDWMKDAAQISVQGHLAAMRWAAKTFCEKSARQGYEYQLQAVLEQTYRHLGSPRVAFSTIAAGGENACILHYTENNAPLTSGDLVLVDSGAEYHGYAGDITHTYPLNGRFSTAQKALYQLVLDAQQAAIDLIAPEVSYDAIHRTACRVLTEGLVKLGILKGELETLITAEAYKPFFMHGTGHWLGMDVHDVGRYKLDGAWRPLQTGMVLTVEPGLYISAGVGREHQVDECYWGIGIRIEDDVLVTETGHEVLTTGLPRTSDEIETYMNKIAQQA